MPPKWSPENSKEACEYKSELFDIINRPLTPEVIDSYADDALGNLIGLVQRSIDSFARKNTKHFDTQKDLETKAFEHYGLGNIEVVLDHIADVSQQIHDIDKIIAAAATTDQVIVPPSDKERPTGDGSFEKPAKAPRLKTVLFVLANDFGIDIHDQQQLPPIMEGRIRPSMMRQESYRIVDAPTINRVILVCDASENRTFIFDKEQLENNEVPLDQLMTMEKPELDALIAEHPLVGSGLQYSKHFVPRLIAKLNNPVAPEKPEVTEKDQNRSYLYPKPTPGIKSKTRTADELGVDKKTIDTVLAAIGDELGDVATYDYGGGIYAPGYSEQQRLVIRKYLEENGMLIPKAPKDIRSFARFAARLHVKKSDIDEAADELEDMIGKAETFRFYNQATKGLDSMQRRAVYTYLKANGRIVPPADEDDRSEKGLAEDLGIDKWTVGSAAKKLRKSIGDDAFGETPIKRFGGTDTRSYNLEQQSMLWGQLDMDESLAEQAPDWARSATMIAAENGLNERLIYKTIKKLKDDPESGLGDVTRFKFRSRVGDGFDERQQELIVQSAISNSIRKES